MPRSAVVIPVHNGLDYTRRSLAALDIRDDETFVVVVDDGSTDGTSEWLRANHPRVTVLEGSGDLWWSGAVNVGCRYAIERGADVLILYNNDNVEVSRAILDRLTDLVRRTGACVSAVALRGNTVLHAGGTIDWRNRGAQLRQSGEAYAPTEEIGECDWLPGTALAMSSSLFVALGGVDARRFPQYRGDIDLTMRARNLGRRCLVAGDVFVVNDAGQSGLNFSRPLSLREIAEGLVSKRSPYNLREAVGFAVRHCPAHLLPGYLGLYYSRYLYACVKARHPSVGRLREALRPSSRLRPS
jgi:GT2 family glycosyltransferase